MGQTRGVGAGSSDDITHSTSTYMGSLEKRGGREKKKREESGSLYDDGLTLALLGEFYSFGLF